MGSTHVESQLKDSTGGASKKVQTSTVRDLQPRRRMDSDQTVFKVYKGVKAFDFCKEKNVIVTGGEGFLESVAGDCFLLLFTVCSSALTQEFLHMFTSSPCRDGTKNTKKRDVRARLLFC